MSSDEEKLQRIQEIVDQGLSADYSMHLIRQLFPRTEPNPITPPSPKDSKGWVMFGDGAVIPLPDNDEPFYPRDAD